VRIITNPKGILTLVKKGETNVSLILICLFGALSWCRSVAIHADFDRSGLTSAVTFKANPKSVRGEGRAS